MEEISEFQKWMEQLLSDAKAKLKLTDITLAFLLMDYAIKIYLKSKADLLK